MAAAPNCRVRRMERAMYHFLPRLRYQKPSLFQHLKTKLRTFGQVK